MDKFTRHGSNKTPISAWQSLPLLSSLAPSNFTSRWVFRISSIPVVFQGRKHSSMNALSEHESEYLAYLPQDLIRKKELWSHWLSNMLSITPEVGCMCAFNQIDFSRLCEGGSLGMSTLSCLDSFRQWLVPEFSIILRTRTGHRTSLFWWWSGIISSSGDIILDEFWGK